MTTAILPQQPSIDAPAPAGTTAPEAPKPSADKPASSPTTAPTPDKPATGTPAAADAPKSPPAPPADDEDGEPTGDAEGMVRMPVGAFMRRVARMTKRELRRVFGTDDVDKIVEERQELQRLRTAEEQRKRDAMTEQERLKADKEAAEKRAAEAEDRARHVEEQRVVERVESDVLSTLRRFVDDDDADDVADKLARHIRSEYSAAEADRPTMKDVEKWAQEFVERHPKWKRGAGAAQPVAAKDDKPAAKDDKPAPAKVPLTNGPRAARGGTPPASGSTDARTARPGDGMSKTEIQRKFGVSW